MWKTIIRRIKRSFIHLQSKHYKMNTYYFDVTTTTGEEYKDYWLDAKSLSQAWTELILIFKFQIRKEIETCTFKRFTK